MTVLSLSSIVLLEISRTSVVSRVRQAWNYTALVSRHRTWKDSPCICRLTWFDHCISHDFGSAIKSSKRTLWGFNVVLVELKALMLCVVLDGGALNWSRCGNPDGPYDIGSRSAGKVLVSLIESTVYAGKARASQ